MSDQPDETAGPPAVTMTIEDDNQAVLPGGKQPGPFTDGLIE